MPTEADYDAIREAFMETSRGRWFLTEYAKRNRNADTNLVLDAVSRLEASLASQKQDQRDRTQEVIAAINALVIEARSEAAVLIAVRDTPDEDSPALKGVRVLREMAWTLRESGNDNRIPDLLSRQADAIEEGLKAAIDETARDHLLSIFDRLAGEIEALGESGTAAAPASFAPDRPSTMSDSDMTGSKMADSGMAVPEPAHEAAAVTAPQAAGSDGSQALTDQLQAVADAIAADGLADEATEALATGPEAIAEPAQAQASQAQASHAQASPAQTSHSVLGPAQEEQLAALRASLSEAELVWEEAEEAAPEGEAIAADEIIAADMTSAVMEDARPAATIEVSTTAATPQPQPAPQPVPAAAMPTDRMAALEAALTTPVTGQASPAPVSDEPISDAPRPDAPRSDLPRLDDASALSISLGSAPEAAMSLGASLIEKGIVARPNTPRADPLAPFKRMTQAERVAFFS